MSVNAVDWALRMAPVDGAHDGHARLLIALANVADTKGRDAHPTQKQMATWCRCSVSTIKRRLEWLEAQGLIRRGDQRLVSHFGVGHRPVVWDLCLDKTSDEPIDFDTNDLDSVVGGRPRTGGNPGPHVNRGSQLWPVPQFNR
ncbi:helix-turn-helix domain-containing protein [Bifidobacterium aesculapii]|uniref:helix-turn-helix domain-containing protein n=1 Tax=Bifidobacterium aesculapii TaxID=1329411 RepID=UPI0006E2DF4D|nr:helix-turn-helix domain-containing protein [Bifidobacterium aesculapii]